MTFDQEDQQIQNLFKEVGLKKPGSNHMLNFEGEVLEAIASSRIALPPLFLVTLGVSVAALILMGLYFVLNPKPVKPSPSAPISSGVLSLPADSEKTAMLSAAKGGPIPAKAQTISTINEEVMIQMADDLLLLDLLGEQEIVEDINLVSDLEIAAQGMPAV